MPDTPPQHALDMAVNMLRKKLPLLQWDATNFSYDKKIIAVVATALMTPPPPEPVDPRLAIIKAWRMKGYITTGAPGQTVNDTVLELLDMIKAAGL